MFYINDITEASSFFRYTLFADDSTLSCEFADVSQSNIVNRVNTELEHVHCWLQANRICLNTDKTKYIVFKYRNPIVLQGLKVGPHKIEQATEFKFLGGYTWTIIYHLHTI